MELTERVMKRIDVISERLYNKYHPTSIDIDDLRQECYIYVINSISTNEHAVDSHLTKVCKSIIRSKGFSFPIKGELSDYQIRTHTAESISSEYLDSMVVEYDMESLDLDSLICRSMSVLTDREKLVISLRYYNGMTLDEIGYVLELTGKRIREIEVIALHKLRNPYRSKILRDYVRYERSEGKIIYSNNTFESIIANEDRSIINRIDDVIKDKSILSNYRSPGSYAREEYEKARLIREE